MSNFEQFIEWALRPDSHLKTDEEVTEWVNGLSPADLFDQFEGFCARSAAISGSDRYEQEEASADHCKRVMNIMRPRMTAILSVKERPVTDNPITGMDDNTLIASYDHFNSEREKISRQWGSHMSGDDMKKVEALTEKINLMRTEIVRRMTVGA